MTRVALVGPGAIGLTFGAAAGTAGHDVVICARRPLGGRAEVELADGRRVRLDAPVYTEPGSAGGRADVVLLAVKAHQTEGAARWLAGLCGPQTIVAVLQNGIEQRAVVEPFAGEATVLPCAVWCPADVVAPGRVRAGSDTRLVTADDAAGRALAALFEGSYAVVQLTDDLELALWSKLVTNTIAGLMALSDPRATMFARPDVQHLAIALGNECRAVALATGVELPETIATGLIAYFLAHPEASTSIAVDRQAGRSLEWDARNGVICRLGDLYGVETPVSDVIVPLLAAASDAAS